MVATPTDHALFDLLVFAGRAPKHLKVFINQPQTLDFDQAEQYKPVQEFRYRHSVLSVVLLQCLRVQFNT